MYTRPLAARFRFPRSQSLNRAGSAAFKLPLGAVLLLLALALVQLPRALASESIEVDLVEECISAESASEPLRAPSSSGLCRSNAAGRLDLGDQVIGLRSAIMAEPRPATRRQEQVPLPQARPQARERGGAEMGRPGRGAKQIPRACHRLMNPQTGELGSWGQSVASILREPRYQEAFTAEGSLGRFCPRFGQLSQSQRIRAWVWFWTVLANEESTCNANLYHPTHFPDGRVLNPNEAHGLWAVELRASVRRSNGRGPACNEIASVEGQARCAIDMAFKLQLNRGRPISTKFTRQYWGPINRQERQILPNMQRFTPCF